MDLTPKQQTSEAIRQAENILILTGQHPSIDQVAATIALSAVLRKFGKKVTAIISDSLPPQTQFLGTTGLDRGMGGLRDFILKVNMAKSEVDKLRYEVEDGKLNIYITPFQGGFAPSDVTFAYGDYKYDVAITLGVPTRARIDRVFEQNKTLFANLPILNIDFHRSNENYGAVNLIEPTASSLSEILVALAESLQNGIIDESIATALLAGIMASTDRFTATHTTSKSLTVAAQLMAAGANQPDVVRGLFRDSRDNRDKDNRDRGDQPRGGGQGGGQGNQSGQSGSGQPTPDRKPQTDARPRTEMTSEPQSVRDTANVVADTATESLDDPLEDIIAPMHIEPMPTVEAQDIPMAEVAPIEVAPITSSTLDQA